MTQYSEELTYSIQQVANISGLSKQVIRKWEERYGIVNPQRLDNGYRIYSHNEVNRILFVKSLVENGYTVKQAAMHVQQQSNEEEIIHKAKEGYIEPPKTLNEHVISLLHEGAMLHEENINRILQQAYLSLGLRKFLYSVVVPFLKEVGNRWSDGRWGEYQEALSSLAIRDFLVQLRRNFHFNENAPIIIGACLPEERHEIPLHIILLEGMLNGWKTVALGPSPAPSAIQSSVEQLNPRKVILSAITTLPFEKNPEIIQDLDEFAAQYPHIQFYIGGPGAEEFLKDKSLDNIIFSDTVNEIL
ncbi:MerR family transcriptional regulator [Bacillus sp. S/N-304-OC-R1]|uniref:MerR family transcriptional regulator n=1 Tax=Bacillus sp. S/N-304-OC-R1 TaxID=2758034 RepID=UPI001C8D020D|nr:MerR family transcriptional regulator [Bacillus sp. S/N-304-OC-R1]MBY0121348.1 MerR family transcriptional regulator [Bacillus sp. S/N-304-OC-R1]